MEENSKTFLEPILWLLKVLKFFGGLPLDITFTDGRTKIKFSWWQGIKMVFLLFIVAITMIAPQFYELLCSLFSGQPSSELFAKHLLDDAMKYFGFSHLDVLASTFFVTCGLLSWILYFFAFKLQVENLKMFCQGVEKFNKKYYNKYNKKLINTKGATRNVLLTWLSLFLGLIPITAGMVIIYQKIFLILKKDYPLMVLMWFYIGGSICSCICCYMPIFASGDLITSYLIGYMSNHFEIWCSEFQEEKIEVSPTYQLSTETQIIQDSENRKEKNQRHFTSQIQAGLSLCALVDQLNTALQGLLSLMFINCASESIFCIYFASSTAIYNDNYKMAPILIGYIFFFFIYIWRLTFLSKSGQGLINAMKRSKICLEDFMITSNIEAFPNESISILKSRLNNDAPISPYSAFPLSHRGLVAVLGVLLTYFIVLIQFKSSGS